MGINWRTGESWIATNEDIYKTSALQRVGEHRGWDAEGLPQIKGVPWDHTQLDAVLGDATALWSERPDDDQERLGRRRSS